MEQWRLVEPRQDKLMCVIPGVEQRLVRPEDWKIKSGAAV